MFAVSVIEIDNGGARSLRFFNRGENSVDGVSRRHNDRSRWVGERQYGGGGESEGAVVAGGGRGAERHGGEVGPTELEPHLSGDPRPNGEVLPAPMVQSSLPQYQAQTLHW